jgi:hypothetical protein
MTAGLTQCTQREDFGTHAVGQRAVEPDHRGKPVLELDELGYARIGSEVGLSDGVDVEQFRIHACLLPCGVHWSDSTSSAEGRPLNLPFRPIRRYARTTWAPAPEGVG